MAIIITSQITTEGLAHRIPATLISNLSPYLAAANVPAPNATASQAPA